MRLLIRQIVHMKPNTYFTFSPFLVLFLCFLFFFVSHFAQWCRNGRSLWLRRAPSCWPSRSASSSCAAAAKNAFACFCTSSFASAARERTEDERMVRPDMMSVHVVVMGAQDVWPESTDACVCPCMYVNIIYFHLNLYLGSLQLYKAHV